MSRGQDYFLLAMDMGKVGGPLSVVKVCASKLCKNRVSVSGWSLSVAKASQKFEHPKSTPYYFSFRLILSANYSCNISI